MITPIKQPDTSRPGLHRLALTAMVLLFAALASFQAAAVPSFSR